MLFVAAPPEMAGGAAPRVGLVVTVDAMLKDLEGQMREAATNLEFEKAARFRDEIKRLREMELDTLDGHLDE